jgi:WD40 repeat protein
VTTPASSSVFVSHASGNRDATVRFCERLRAEGVHAYFVDIDPVHGLVGGSRWEQVLYAQVGRADAIVFLRSPASLASPWCFAELALARSLGKPVFPVVIDRSAPSPSSEVTGPFAALLADTQFIELVDEPDRGFEQLWTAMRRRGLDPRDSFGWDVTRTPYPGLMAFEAPDAGVFFGRDREIHQLLDKLRPIGPRGRCVALVGPSGSGKSSLLRAGLLPRLARLSDRWRLLPPMTPGGQPLRALARVLVAASGDRDRHGVTQAWERLRGGPAALGELIEELRDADPTGPEATVLVLDQAEELATQSDPEQAEAFLVLLAEALRNTPSVWVLATIRAEFAAALLSRPGTGQLVDEAQLISPLEDAALFRVIEGPADRAGLRFAPGLPARLVTETRGVDALPLLAFTLRRLVDAAGPDGMITEASYEHIGGVLGSLQLQADQTARRLAGGALAEHVIDTLVQLADVTESGDVTRRRVARDDLSDTENAVMQAFVDDRLLVSDIENGTSVVTVAHEALLRRWPPLAEAIEQRRDDLLLRAQLVRRVAEWRASDRAEADLLTASRLDAAVLWAERNPRDADRLPDARAYLVAGLELRDRLAEERAEAARQQERAGTLELVAQLRTRSEQVTALLGLDPVAALTTAVAAVGENREIVGGEPLGFVQSALFSAVRAARQRQVLRGHEMTITGLAVGPDGRWLVTGSHDHTLRIWPFVGPRRVGAPRVVPVGAAVTSVATGPDGLIAAGDDRGRITFWRPDGTAADEPVQLGNEPVLVALTAGLAAVAYGGCMAIIDLTRPDRPRQGLAVSGYVAALMFAAGCPVWVTSSGLLENTTPLDIIRRSSSSLGRSEVVTSLTCLASGQIGLVAVGQGGDIVLTGWGEGAPRRLPITRGPHDGMVTAVAFGADGSALVIGDETGHVRLLNVSGSPIGDPLPTGGRPVSGIVVGPGSAWFTAACDDEVLLYDWLESPPRPLPRDVRRPAPAWDSHGDQLGPAWPAHDFVAGLAFAGAESVISVGGDRRLRCWDLDGTERYTVEGAHEGGITCVARAVTGLVATGGRDNAVRLWTARGRPVGALAGHRSDVMGVAFTPDGALLASGGRDGTVRLWRPDGEPVGGPFATGADEVLAVAFAVDGERVACACSDGTVQLWSTDGVRLERAGVHHGVVWDVAFSPDGTHLASAGDDRAVRLWENDEPGSPLLGHTAAVRACAFHPAGQPLVTAGADGTVRLWERGGTQLTRPLAGHEGPALTVAVDPTGRYAATGGTDGTIRVWRLGHWESWLAEAGDRLADHLTRADPDDPVAAAAARAVGIPLRPRTRLP